MYGESECVLLFRAHKCLKLPNFDAVFVFC